MYTVAVQRDFIAQHYLIGGDWGAENQKHSHHYRIELQLQGRTLDAHGYLVDIVDIERYLDETIAGFRDRLLNDQPAFAGLNPSLEHFTRILAHELHECIKAPNIEMLQVTLWENEIAWARYTHPRQA